MSASKKAMNLKFCSACKTSFALDQFYKSSASKDGHKSTCKACYLIENTKTRKTRDQKYNKTDKAKSVSKKYRTSTRAQYTFCQRQAAKRKIKFELSFDDFKKIRIKQACYYCSGPLPECGGGLDRIDNKGSYSKENVLPCCHSCNMTRGDRFSVTETKAAIAAIKEQRDRSLTGYMNDGVHLDYRLIYIGEIDAESSHKIIKGIDELEAINPHSPINIQIMSEGGNWSDALGIYDRLKQSTCPIIATGMGIVASSATVIFQAADERILYSHCIFVVHDGLEGFEGDPKSFEAWAERSKKSRELMYQIYSDKTGKMTLYWENKCSHDSIMSAQEAVDVGLADKIAGVKKVKSSPPTKKE